MPTLGNTPLALMHSGLCLVSFGFWQAHVPKGDFSLNCSVVPGHSKIHHGPDKEHVNSPSPNVQIQRGAASRQCAFLNAINSDGSDMQNTAAQAGPSA